MARVLVNNLGRFRILPLPLVLCFLAKEPHLGWFALDPSAFLNGPEVPINLDFVQVVLLVFAVPLLESGGVSILIPPDVVADITVERSAMNLKQRYFFIETGGAQTGMLGTFEPFQSLNCFVEPAIHQENCFVQMSLLHSNFPFWPALGRSIRRPARVSRDTYPDRMERRIKGTKWPLALRERRGMLEQKGGSQYA
jgi:hypothetical protein